MTATELTVRQKTLLTFLGADDTELDPVRIMKGLFLVAMEARTSWLPEDARYHFVPYNYGPLSFDIYRDLDELGALGLAQGSSIPGRSWSVYRLSPKGVHAASRACKDLHPDLLAYIKEVRGFVTRLPFRQLLTAVYSRYPTYAVNSVFKT